MQRFLIWPFALLIAGCATADFTPYSGMQQNWPVATGAFVETKYEVLVYRGPPDRAYWVLGHISFDTAAVLRRSVTALMARRAKEMGGDGLILLSTLRGKGEGTVIKFL